MEDAGQALEWGQNLTDWLAGVPVSSPVFQAAVQTVYAAVEDHSAATAWVDTYVATREELG